MSDKNRVIIFDTTLRDGEQSPGASLNVGEKIEIAKQLARLGVDVIEAGFPISSQADFDAVKLIAETVHGPTICGLARAVPMDVERAGEALKGGKQTRIHTFIATSDIHMQYKLKKSREEVLDMAVAAVKQAKQYTDDVEFSPEDAVRSDFDFMCQVLEAAIDAGATTVNIPDTVGYSMPWEYGDLIRRIVEKVSNIHKAVVSVHCHNDLGLAVANSLAGMLNGARQIECTINGIGERAGNTSLEEVVMAIKTRADLMCVHTNIVTKEIYRTSRLVSDLTGFVVQPNKAIVGKNAFAHEAGIHQHGVLSHAQTYEIMDPRDIGLDKSELVLGRHSGMHALVDKLEQMGYTDLSDEQKKRVYQRFKDIAAKKKDISEWDIESIVSDEIHQVPEMFHLEYMHVVSGGSTIPTATMRIRKGDDVITAAEMGVGTVDAVFKAIDAICNVPHRLVDYTVKSVTGGTDALGEVTVRIRDGGSVYIGRGASPDVIEASAKAYLQAINKLVSRVPYGNGRPTAQRMEVKEEEKMTV